MSQDLNANRPAWAIQGFLEIKNNHLAIGGVDAHELIEAYQSPLYVFSEQRIRHNIERLKRAETALGGLPLKVCYAAKANSNMAILRAVREAGADIETNSGGELFKALKIGFRPDQIIFNGTSKTEDEHADAIRAGIYAIQADSFFEVEQIERVARRLNKPANVSLRLVPEIETDTMHGLQTAMLTSKFGMLSNEVFECFQRFGKSEFVRLKGIHLHLGSQTPDAAPFAEAFLKLFKVLKEIYEETGIRLEHLNLGGGFPTNYALDDANLLGLPAERRNLFAADLEPAEVLAAAMHVVRKVAEQSDALNLLDNLTILLEPGRSVIADAGILLTTVRNIKSRPLMQTEAEIQNPESRIQNDDWLLTDAGYNLMLSMNNYKWYYHLISASRATEEHETPYKLAGPLCDGGDVYFDIEGTRRLPDYRLLPESVQPGEVLALLNVGAYSYAQMFPYNGRPLPAAVLIGENGSVELIRKADTYETLIESDVW
ncbi:MAG: diaminopimelate decarboxylase [Acidobacteriota bacterium]|nr:diaminopimelate decarboxylase [Acidobacteriota bacterium]